MGDVADVVAGARAERQEEFDGARADDIDLHRDGYGEGNEPDFAVWEHNGRGQQDSINRAGSANGRYKGGSRSAGVHDDFGKYVDASRADARQEKIDVKAVRTPGAFQVHAKHPEEKHVQQDVPEAAVQEDVGHRLPKVQLEKKIEWDEPEFTIHQDVGGWVK